MNDELQDLKEYITNQIADWAKRRDEKLQAPFPSDAPCYYCTYVIDGKTPTACKYCIQNPEAEIFKEEFWDN